MDFYIVYQPNAPESHKRWGRRFFWILSGIVTLVAVLFALGQKGFSSGQYEYGKLTELEGVYMTRPFPHLRIYNGKGFYGEHDFRSVLLVGDRKHGAGESIEKAEALHGAAMRDSVYAKVRGTLIYNDGKTLLELTEREKSFLGFRETPPELLVDSSSVGVIGGFEAYKLETTLLGEIIDPKCYFGAMKPGEGKVHKSCAILCVSGGIPPVLKVSSPSSNEYYLLLHDNGSPVNEAVLDYIAEPVEITGHLESMDDWWVLYINPETSIKKL
jgi:hypothetical protein